jgi:hypothetical protein
LTATGGDNNAATAGSDSALMSASNIVNGTSASYTYVSGGGASGNRTHTQVGGTWRVLRTGYKAIFNACYGGTFGPGMLCIRVS